MREAFIPFFVAALVVTTAWSSRGGDNRPQDRGPIGAQDVPRDPPAGLDDRVRWIVERARGERGLEALSLHVTWRGETLVSEAWGTNAGAPIDASTPLPVGAGAHYLLVASVLHAAHAREVDLDRPIAELLPGHELPWSDVTLRMLLAHTSGLPDLDPPRAAPIEATAPRASDDEEEEEEEEPRGVPLRRFMPEPIAAVHLRQDDEPTDADEADAPLARERTDAWLPRLREAAVGPAGESFRWSNANLLLALLWLEETTGESVESYVRRSLLPQIGLEPRSLPAPATPAETWARARVDLGRLLREESAWPTELRMLGLGMTPADLVALHTAIASGDLLSEASSEAMLGELPLEPAEEEPERGFVMHRTWLDPFAGRAHGGAVGGDSMRLAQYPHVDLTVALVGRGGHDSLASLERAIARAVLDLPQSDLADLPLPAEELERYLGHYRIGSTRAVIALRDGRLELRLFDGTYPLAYQGGGRFAAVDGREVSLRFDRDEDGRATRFELRRRGVEMMAQRVD